jgi:hypothetical protein
VQTDELLAQLTLQKMKKEPIRPKLAQIYKNI